MAFYAPLALIALLVTYLPSLYAAFQRREAGVAKLEDALAGAGIPMKADRDRAWRDFAGWRVNYDAALIGLARVTMAPDAPWSSDRVREAHFVPPAFPWLRRGSRQAARRSV